MSGASAAARQPEVWLWLRFAAREMRGGLRGFAVFIACIALGVMAISGVASFNNSIADSLAREGSVIVGGDATFNLIQREADPAELAFLASQGRVSTAATLRTMARRSDGGAALVELKAVDAAYPLYGTLVTAPQLPPAALFAQRDGAFGAAADPALMARLDLKPGARIMVGAAAVEIRASVVSEPDKLAGGLGFGPRLLLSQDALQATGLVQPGSLVHWHYRVRLPQTDVPDAAIGTLIDAAKAKFPDAGWEIRSRTNASPQLERNVQRFTQFLTLVGLTALLVGGVGVANAVKSHLDRKRDVIATMKALGATGRRVFGIYLVQVLGLAAIGSGIGILLGAVLPFIIAAVFHAVIPLPIVPAVYPGALALSVLYGILTAVAFALWPLGRAHDVPVSALFRDAVSSERRLPRKIYIAATAAMAVVLAGLAVALAYDRTIAAMFVGAAAAVFVLLRGVAWLLMLLARSLPRPRSTVWRLAIANIHRPGALTPSIVLSLGLGLALLVTVVEIDGNLRQQFSASLPDKAPSFFFIDIPSADGGRFDTFVHDHAGTATLDRVPMLRGRIVAVNGTKVADLKPASQAAWVLQSDRGITFTGDVPQGSKIVEAQWWGRDYSGPPLLSFDNKIAEGLGLHVGDPVTVNVLGRNITARVSNLRQVEWENLGINFVLVYSPGAFAGAPHSDIASITFPDGGTAQEENALFKAVTATFPAVTVVRVKDALEAVGKLVRNLVLGIRGASVITLLAAVMVLGGALAAGHRHRVYDAVVLKTLGATRRRLLGAFALEYFLLGLATAIFGVAAGSVAGWLVVAQVMDFTFAWAAGPAIAAALGALAITVGLGLLGTVRALNQKAAPVLRHM